MLAILLSLFMGCADPYADAQKADTIESWDNYLTKEKPSGSEKSSAEQRLSELMVQKARTAHTLEAYDAAIKRFPKHKDIKKLIAERMDVSWDIANKANTVDSWKKFLDENPDAPKIQRERARGFVGVLEYGKITVGEVKAEEVNLAEDPKGPKDGWGFTATITNAGDQDIEYMNVEIQYLDAAGLVVGSEKWPLVAQNGPANMPVTSETKQPLKAGQSRVWEYSTNKTPTTWAKQSKVIPVSIRFVGTPAKEGPNEGAAATPAAPAAPAAPKK